MSKPSTLEEIQKKFKDNLLENVKNPTRDPRLPWSDKEIALLLSLIKNHSQVVLELRDTVANILEKNTKLQKMVLEKSTHLDEIRERLEVFDKYNIFNKYQNATEEITRQNILIETLQNKIKSSLANHNEPEKT